MNSLQELTQTNPARRLRPLLRPPCRGHLDVKEFPKNLVDYGIAGAAEDQRRNYLHERVSRRLPEINNGFEKILIEPGEEPEKTR